MIAFARRVLSEWALQFERSFHAHLEARLSHLSSQLDAMGLELVEARRPRVQVGQVVVLWREPDGTPRLLSRTPRFHLPGEQVDIAFETYWPIPAGAWVVAIGCQLAVVRVGLHCEDVGVEPRGSICCLSQALQTGMRLGVTVVSPVPLEPQRLPLEPQRRSYV